MAVTCSLYGVTDYVGRVSINGKWFGV
uniref:Uncharacterized protein n=1 Tax=Rhizophora mucronata TaxID=61149 RepID=A0A2P2NIB4_RHIMU